MESKWRDDVSPVERNHLTQLVYGELLRIFGETDAHKVWGSATAFELAKWKASKNKVPYTAEMQRTIASLRNKPAAGKSIPSPLQQKRAARQTQAKPTTDATAMELNTEQSVDPGKQADARPPGDMVAPPEQTEQQWRDESQEPFRVQHQQLLRMHKVEITQLRKAQHSQKQRLVQGFVQQSGTSGEQRRLQLQRLTQQHAAQLAHVQRTQQIALHRLHAKQRQQYQLAKKR